MKPMAPVTSTLVSLGMNIAPLAITLGVMNEKCYVLSMIKSFKGEETEKIFRGQFSRKLPQAIQRVAARKLEQLHAATVLETLRVPPGNRLEALTHNRQGQHSIQVNEQWRVCFVWRDGDAYDVEIVDYH
jgi:proteic killer suppression protein